MKYIKMSFKIVSKKYAKLSNIELKYLSTKVDKYKSEFAYYSIIKKILIMLLMK